MDELVMRTLLRRQLEGIYGRAQDDWRQLPWHMESVPPFLQRAIGERPAGDALDLGCGTAGYSIRLAENGWRVTGVDCIPEALGMATQRIAEAEAAAGRSLGIQLKQNNAAYLPEGLGRFQLVLDSGVMQSLAGSQLQQYCRLLQHLLADDGDLLLVHFLRRTLQEEPPVEIMPYMRTQAEVEALLPGLHLHSYYTEIVPVPDEHGDCHPACIAKYWFTRR